MRCPNCGAPLPQTGSFCPECGAQLDRDSELSFGEKPLEVADDDPAQSTPVSTPQTLEAWAEASGSTPAGGASAGSTGAFASVGASGAPFGSGSGATFGPGSGAPFGAAPSWAPDAEQTAPPTFGVVGGPDDPLRNPAYARRLRDDAGAARAERDALFSGQAPSSADAAMAERRNVALTVALIVVIALLLIYLIFLR